MKDKNLRPFLYEEKHLLSDPGLTGEVNFSHCLYEIFYVSCQPGLGGEVEKSLSSMKSE